jgi:nucleotide-binding universal stress UspA family protein
MTEIVVGIDDSAGAQDALAFAARVARATGATLRLVSVFPYSDVPSRGSVPAYREYLRADARALLDRAVAATDAPVGTTDAIADMSPAHALHQLCERLDAALVVVGSTRRGPVGRIVPGSTGERLLHGSPCPVAIVPRGYADAGPVTTVGVGYDGSHEAEAALAAGYQAARRFEADLRVIRIFDATRFGSPALMTIPGYVTENEDYEVRQREGLDEAVAAIPGDVRVETAFVAGSAGHELAAQSEGVDLMLVGSRGYGPRAAVLLGGVTHTLLRKAACPVVVLPLGSRGLDRLAGHEIVIGGSWARGVRAP